MPPYDHEWIQPTLHDGPQVRRRYTLAHFIAAAAEATNLSDLCRALGLVPRGANYETVRNFAAQHGVNLTHLESAMARRLDCTRDELLAAVRGAVSKAEVLRRLGHEPCGPGYRWLNRMLAKHAIDVSLAGRRWARGKRRPRRVPIEHYLRMGRLPIGTSQLRVRLIEEGVMPGRCSRCGRDRWEGSPIPLELDHINGDRLDNTLENLRLLCPNCHALTATYRGRNIGRGSR